MRLDYNNCSYEIEVVRKKNKNTYIRIRNNKIIITTNYFVTTRYLKGLIKNNYSSITKMLDQELKRNQDNDKFILFGKKYKIIYDSSVDNVKIFNNEIYVKDDKKMNKWLDNYIEEIFLRHLLLCYNLFGEDIPKPTLKIRIMKTRWGVCNTRTFNITLNKDLYRYDIECLDYVCIHELSHLIEANHSKRFWNIVEKYCPDYKNLRRKLKS